MSYATFTTSNCCYPNLGKITKSWFPLRIRTTMQGLVASFAGRAGGALAPFIIGTVLMAWVGLTWQGSLYILASVGLLYAVVFWMLFRNSPGEHPRANAAEITLIEEGEVQLTGEKPKIIWTRANVTNLGVCGDILYSFPQVTVRLLIILHKEAFSKAVATVRAADFVTQEQRCFGVHVLHPASDRCTFLIDRIQRAPFV